MTSFYNHYQKPFCVLGVAVLISEYKLINTLRTGDADLRF